MPEWSALVVFLGASLALLLTPGPAVLYIVARSIDQGRMAGLVSALGVGMGTMFHVAAAALGLSALLASSALAFAVVKYAGAAYLVYLGVRKLLEKPPAAAADSAAPGELPPDSRPDLRRIFRQGVIVNILNPKTALFFFAFLPQFADPLRGPLAVQLLLLGLIFVGLGILSDSLYALLAGTARGALRRSLVFIRAQRYVAGGIYIALGVMTAFAAADEG